MQAAVDRQAQHPHRTILAIAAPAILANSSAPLVGLVDTWAIGHLPGARYLAAIGLGSVIFNFIFWAFGFLRMGTTGIVAQAHGRGDKDELVAGVWRSMALALALGCVLLLAQELVLLIAMRALAPPDTVVGLTEEYFHIRIWAAPATLLVYAISGVLFGLARTGAVLFQQLVLNISNAALNVTFVVGFGLGVAGVALGTLVAQWLAVAAGMWILGQLIGWRRLLAGIRAPATWLPGEFRKLVVVNGFIFVRTILLMTALTVIMRVAGSLGDVEMAASHVVMQYMLLISLGLDGFAHATEALAGSAWGKANVALFRRWVRLTGLWAVVASLVYALLFWAAGDSITALLTDIATVRASVGAIMPLVVALPVVAVACYQFDGVYIAATAGAAMMVTMAIAFLVYMLALDPLTTRWGLPGLWTAVLLFMAARGLAQAAWYPRLVAQLRNTA
ncbi:MAG: MATE family efflux transporter [Lysobacterales bacterium]|jgi:MATE family multidrug resistance protein